MTFKQNNVIKLSAIISHSRFKINLFTIVQHRIVQQNVQAVVSLCNTQPPPPKTITYGGVWRMN